MDKDTIRSKIKKLIALSENNPSKEESYSALMKAQALMAQYKIEEGEIRPEEEEKCIMVSTEFQFSKGGSDTYMITLSHILADNFCCVTYSETSYNSKARRIGFMGLTRDVDVVVEAMKTADKAIRYGYDVVWKDLCKEYNVSYIPAKIFNPYKVGYIRGYLDGLKDVLESQKSQMQEWGLVLVAPQEAQDYLSSLSKSEIISQDADKRFYNKGYRDGKAFNMNKKIESDN